MKEITSPSSLNTFSPISISIRNIATNKFLIIHTDNCDLHIENEHGNFFCTRGSFVFMSRNMNFSCRIHKIETGRPPYKTIRLGREELTMLTNILHSTHVYCLNKHITEGKSHNGIVCIGGNKDWGYIFNKIETSKDSALKMLKLSYLISRMGIAPDIIISLMASTAVTFTEKIRNQIENNPSKRWCLNMIADEFNISEISVRKRLESEGTSFSNLFLKVRMEKSMQLLLQNELQICQISKS
ncbi:TPA: AraC family transcriptional regulator, partial [Escherichia coli]|nr:AraC family transcriptional regulator [Escherichia coli]